MEIEQEDVDKLSQLDRIEFKQRLSETQQLFDVGFITSMIFICSSLFLSFFSRSLDSLVFLLLGLIIFLLCRFKALRGRRKLELKYFKVNLKDKKK